MGHQITSYEPVPTQVDREFEAELTYEALRYHPRFKMPRLPNSRTPEKMVKWALDAAAAFVSPTKVDGENEEFTCISVADALREQLRPELLALLTKKRRKAKGKR